MKMTTRNGTTSTLGDSVDERIDSLKESASAIKNRVIDVKDQAMDRGNAVLDKSTDYIKANPLKSVAIAFGVGYIAMRLFR
jgi:ElaB/YqjD/DUF883 family membrane-anchored ribosome-binding protein